MFYPRLSRADTQDILRNCALSDDVIDGAMSLITIHFPQLEGLVASGRGMLMEPFPQPPLFIQIMNGSTAMALDDMSQYRRSSGDHWLTISNVFAEQPDEVVIYDSFYGYLSGSSCALL